MFDIPFKIYILFNILKYCCLINKVGFFISGLNTIDQSIQKNTFITGLNANDQSIQYDTFVTGLNANDDSFQNDTGGKRFQITLKKQDSTFV